MPTTNKTKSPLERITTAHGARKEPKAPHVEYYVQVIADSTNKWISNQLRFVTIDTARGYAIDLKERWTQVRAWRIVDDKGKVLMESEHAN